MRIWPGVIIGLASAFTIAACGSSGDDSGGSGGVAGSAAGAGGGGSGGVAGAGTGGGSAGTGTGGSGGGGAGADGGGGTSASGGSGGSGGVTNFDGGPAASCFVGQFVNGPSPDGPIYDQFNPTVGSHCKGTNMQDIKGVQKVVFLGDSITSGTPPTNVNPAAVYRAILAKQLATLFNLTPPAANWGGNSNPSESGDFRNCAKWGARTDDLMKDGTQVTDCIPADKRNLHYLAIITDGGNDVAAITKDGGGSAPAKTIDQLWTDTKAYVQLMRDAVTWMKDPANVPGGVDVVFGNLYEFTDGTGVVSSCALSGVAGLQAWTDLQSQKDMVVWAEEQYMKIAVDTHSDMIFMLESFCGHGYKRDDPTSPCYRGPGQPLWFDLTCIHPNAPGHAALADLFFQTIKE